MFLVKGDFLSVFAQIKMTSPAVGRFPTSSASREAYKILRTILSRQNQTFVEILRSFEMKIFAPVALALSVDAFKYRDIVDLYYNDGARSLPGDERGIQWHQCGQDTLQLPNGARDKMCTGNKCFLVCNRGILTYGILMSPLEVMKPVRIFCPIYL